MVVVQNGDPSVERTATLKRGEGVTNTAKEIEMILTKFFQPPTIEGKAYRDANLQPDFYKLHELVTPEAMQILIDATPESREFNQRFKIAVQKALTTPLIRPDGTLVTNWTHGHIAFAIDSGGRPLGLDGSPERIKFLNYQVAKALEARVVSEHVENLNERDLSKDENIELLASLGVKKEDQYIGAIDDVLLPVGSEKRWVYIVGGGALPDKEYVEEIFNAVPKKPDVFAGAIEDTIARLTLYYLQNPDVEVRPVAEPEIITRTRKLLRVVS